MTNQWENCYDSSWNGLIVPEAFSHPAKFSRSLISRIYQHAKDEGWIKSGDCCLDPFGGVALGGLDAIQHGLNWKGVELEQKFVDLGKQNIELWQHQLRGLPNLGTARIVQGDSRYLKDVIEKADLVVSSPPWGEGATGGLIKFKNSDEYAQKMSEFAKKNPRSHGGSKEAYLRKMEKDSQNTYGHTPGNLANMKEGDIDLVVSSPPYAECIKSGGDGIDWSKIKGEEGKPNRSLGRGAIADGYGDNSNNLGSMKEGSIDICISSPPYEEGIGHGGKMTEIDKKKALYIANSERYSSDKSNLGNISGDTFWSVSKTILQQCYELLKPSGHAIFVTKRYIKGGKIIEFSNNWLVLCGSVGFKLVCRHQAMLVKRHGKQRMIGGEVKELSTERKSFFRRLAESKGSPRIDWEDILCLEKL